VSSPVETVSLGLTAGRGNGAGAAELGERAVVGDAIWVVAGDDEQFGGGIGADTERIGQRRAGSGSECLQDAVVAECLTVEVVSIHVG